MFIILFYIYLITCKHFVHSVLDGDEAIKNSNNIYYTLKEEKKGHVKQRKEWNNKNETFLNFKTILLNDRNSKFLEKDREIYLRLQCVLNLFHLGINDLLQRTELKFLHI